LETLSGERMKHKYNIGDLFISDANGRGIICNIEEYSTITEYVIYWTDGKPTSMGYTKFEIEARLNDPYKSIRWHYYPVKK
jgi:hypothetical protein